MKWAYRIVMVVLALLFVALVALAGWMYFGGLYSQDEYRPNPVQRPLG